MSVYVTSKRVRYITSIIFVVFMGFIVGGSYLAQQAPTTSSAALSSLK